MLSNTKVDGAQTLPLIETVFLSVECDFDSVDAFIFTSKNGVYALANIYPSWIEKPSIVIGKATATAVTSSGGSILFCSENSYGDSLSDDIAERFGHLRLLHSRAKTVAFDLNEALLGKGVNIRSVATYETRCTNKQLPPPEAFATIIFSSPSTIECFFKRYTWENSYKAVVIGKTTAASMPTDIGFVISPEQTLESAVKLAQTL